MNTDLVYTCRQFRLFIAGSRQANARSVTLSLTGKKLGGASSEGNIP